MSTEYIKRVAVDRNKRVYLETKSNNDNRPYDLWLCESLTLIYQAEGQRGLDREIVRMLCEYAEIRGDHWSVERYKPCLLARGHFSVEHVKRLDAEFYKLTPEDLETRYDPRERQTDAMRAYHDFSKTELSRYYTELAGCAAPLPRNKEAPEREDNGAR